MARGSRGGELAWRHVHWPEVDRAAWEAINRPGDAFDDVGRAVTWTDDSRRNVEHAYGRYLAFLARTGALESVDRVSERLDLAQIKMFAEDLRRTVAPSTVWGILQALARAFSAMDPSADQKNLHKVLTRIKRRTNLTRHLGDRLIDPVELISAANQMMAEAERLRLGMKAAVLYRNGAIILGAAFCPLRLDAWCKLHIQRHLRLEGGRGWISFQANELKATRRPFEAELPREFVIRLTRYITHYRPLLVAAQLDSGFLWLTHSGKQFKGKGLSSTVGGTLMRRRGRAFSFHMFRHAAATFIEDNAPDQSLMAAAVLHHSDFRMTEKHYIRGQRTAAIETYHSLVRRIVRSGGQ